MLAGNRAALSDRTSASSVRRSPLPEGADIISLIRIVHDHDDASALSLLRAVRRALPPDGTLLIGGDVWRQGRRTAGRLLWILYPRHGPRRAKNRRGDRQIAAASRLRPLPSSAQPNAHLNQHPRRPADFELRIGFTMRATVRAASLSVFSAAMRFNLQGTSRRFRRLEGRQGAGPALKTQGRASFAGG